MIIKPHKNILKMRLPILLIIFSCLACISKSNTPLSIFESDTIHEVRMHFKQIKYWDTLISKYEQFHDSDVFGQDLILADVIIDGVTLDSIGVKLKSNFSFSIPGDKKPMKIDFNEFVKGRLFQGLRSLNLSNEFPDPSMLRNTIAYKIFRDAGLHAPRTSFARLFINDKYRGLYILIEQVDKSFIAEHFEHQGGELIKPLASSLAILPGDTMSFIKNFEIKSKNNAESWSRLIQLAKKINTTEPEIFFDSLNAYFDFDSYLPVFAGDIIFNNWDSYFYGQNYYLYRDPTENKYYYLAWDYNVSMNNYNVSGGDFPILPGGSNSHLFRLPLPSKVIANPILKEKYLSEICRINKYMSLDSLSAFIYKMHDMIRPAMKEDQGKIMTMDQFEKSLTNKFSISEMEFEGLLTFIRYRHEQINKLLEIEGRKCR